MARTERELRPLGGRPTSRAALTPAEQRVAELAASGLTNRQVAAALFISPKTVESSLARVYRKLAIRSRAELGAHVARSDRRRARAPASEPGLSRETPAAAGERRSYASLRCESIEARHGVTTFMAECFWPGVTEQQLADAGARAGQAAQAISSNGGLARYLGSILVPADEIALCLFEAPSLDAASELNRRAAIPFERILEIVRLDPAIRSSAGSQRPASSPDERTRA